MKPKVLFAVQGEGRGHLTQAITLRNLFEKNNIEICGILVGTSNRRSIPDFFQKKFLGIPIIQIQSPNFKTINNRGINIFATIVYNLKRIGQYLRSAKVIRTKVNEWKPDIIINFYEPIVGLYAMTTKANRRPPIICIAHQYLVAHNEFEFPKGHTLDRKLLKSYTNLTSRGASLILALSFSSLKDSINTKLKVVPPLLRTEVKTLKVNKMGYYLCYLVNAGYRIDIEKWHKKNPTVCLHVFTDMENENEVEEVRKNLFFHKLNDTKFLEYMAGCNGLISSAGFESVCEAFYMDKPVLMVPVEGHFEQLCNGNDAEKNGVGIYKLNFDIDSFLDWIPSHQTRSESFRKWESKSEELFIKNLNDVLDAQTIDRTLPNQLVQV